MKLKFPDIENDTAQGIGRLVDAGVRATGLQAVREAVAFLDWFEAAEEVREVKEEDNGDVQPDIDIS